MHQRVNLLVGGGAGALQGFLLVRRLGPGKLFFFAVRGLEDPSTSLRASLAVAEEALDKVNYRRGS